nr:glycerol-3-phosphate 1-O-acyltransferase PlsY [Acidiferrobacter sp.]
MWAYVLPGVAYLLGSLSTAIVASRMLGLPDPRHAGSGNPGATNVLRLGGKKAAIITLIGDVLKGAVPVVLARSLGVAPWIVAVTASAALVGHIYPVYFRFRGGKGVATALGVLTAINPIAGAGLLGIWLVVALVFRYSSLAALTAAVAAPFLMAATLHRHVGLFFVMTALMSALLLWRHRSNIRNLLAGRETKIGR